MTTMILIPPADPANQHWTSSVNHQPRNFQNYQLTLHSYLTLAEPQKTGPWLPRPVSCWSGCAKYVARWPFFTLIVAPTSANSSTSSHCLSSAHLQAPSTMACLYGLGTQCWWVIPTNCPAPALYPLWCCTQLWVPCLSASYPYCNPLLHLY